VVSDDDYREFTFPSIELGLPSCEKFIIGRIPNIEGFDIERGKSRFECGEVTLQDDLTGLAIFRMKEVERNGRGRLCLGIKVGEKKNEDKNGSKTLSHDGFS